MVQIMIWQRGTMLFKVSSWMLVHEKDRLFARKPIRFVYGFTPVFGKCHRDYLSYCSLWVLFFVSTFFGIRPYWRAVDSAKVFNPFIYLSELGVLLSFTKIIQFFVWDVVLLSALRIFWLTLLRRASRIIAALRWTSPMSPLSAGSSTSGEVVKF